jgi:predicted ATPase
MSVKINMEDESLPFNSSEFLSSSPFTLDSHSSAFSHGSSKDLLEDLNDPHHSHHYLQAQSLPFNLDYDPSATSLPSSRRRSSRATKSSQAVLSELTINKLRFDESHLYGRGDDIKTLQNIFEKSKVSRQLLLLRGEAGTGKSALSAQLKSTVRRSGGIYVTGKFDYQQQETPLFGISMACQDLCRTILSLRRDDSFGSSGSSRKWPFTPSFEEVQSKLRSEIGAETQVLATLTPLILDILGEDHAVDNETFDFEKSKRSFHSAFRRWIRAVGSFGPLVVVLDDLQLADIASLELIQSMLADKDNPGLMVICTYRTEEVDAKHPLLETIRRIEENANEGAGITAIDVENLSIEHLNSMFRDVLNLHGDTAYGLASCVHRKTMGNAFFAIQLLKSLSERGLLTYNLGSSSWTWDIKSIRRVVVATENVAVVQSYSESKLVE